MVNHIGPNFAAVTTVSALDAARQDALDRNTANFLTGEDFASSNSATHPCSGFKSQSHFSWIENVVSIVRISWAWSLAGRDFINDTDSVKSLEVFAYSTSLKGSEMAETTRESFNSVLPQMIN